MVEQKPIDKDTSVIAVREALLSLVSLINLKEDLIGLSNGYKRVTV